MKKNKSIKKIIMWRYVLYTVGIIVVLIVMQRLLDLILSNTSVVGFHYNLKVDNSVSLTPERFVISIAWNMFVLSVYGISICMFGKSISKKIVEPFSQMAEGFRAVTNGDLEVSLDTETESEFSDMCDAFNYMVERLRKSEELRVSMENERMQLFSNIAHDLKTPITTITGYAGALANHMVEDTQKQHEYHLAIRSKATQVNQLLDQLLSYSKLSAPQYRLNYTVTDLAELIRVSCASLFGEIEDNQMELKLCLPEKSVYCTIDKLEIDRALSNLLSNAIQHNPIGSLLKVHLKEDQKNIYVEVADNGLKISAAFSENIFKPFISGDPARGAKSGTGLGLSIVEQVMHKHNGRISLIEDKYPYTKKFVMCFPK